MTILNCGKTQLFCIKLQGKDDRPAIKRFTQSSPCTRQSIFSSTLESIITSYFLSPTFYFPPSPSPYPSATSSAIIRVKPTEKQRTPMLECAPSDISGISSSTTT